VKAEYLLTVKALILYWSWKLQLPTVKAAILYRPWKLQYFTDRES